MSEAMTAQSNIVDFRRPLKMSDGNSSEQPGRLSQIIYETNTTTKFLVEQLNEIREERKASERKREISEERLWIELRSIKRESSEDAKTVSLRQEMADRRAGEIERRLGEVAESVKVITGELITLKRPIETIVEVKKRLLWLTGLVGAAIFALLTVGRPWYDSWVATWFGRGK
jgi:hypothetical protein